MALSSSSRFKFRKRSLLRLACASAFAASCNSEVTEPRGQLMLAITTDLSIDEDMNQVRVEVTDVNGAVLDAADRDIIPTGDDAMPGTLALVPPNSGGQTVHIRVMAKKNGKVVPRVVREAIAKVPTDRVAMLRMPLHFLCADLPDSCQENNTCKAGKCVPSDVDSNLLPDYTEAAVFGGGDAHGKGSYCLDVQSCFEHTSVLAPNKADCSVPLPKGADLAKLNVALVLPPMTEGHCLPDDDGTPKAGNCLIPLDDDAEEGFVISGNRIKLPPAACERPSVVGVSLSTTCRTKDLSVPICGPWTGWATQPGPDAGSAGAAGSSELASGGTSGKGTVTEPMGGAGMSGADGGAAGEPSDPPGPSCPVTAELAPAYYYVLVDTSANMQPALATIRQALIQFAGETASVGTHFGVQVAAPVCQGDYSMPVLGFTVLPLGNAQFPSLQAGAQSRLQLDSAMLQTVDTLQAVPSPASRTLVVLTSAVDQTNGADLACGTLVDLMHQALSSALGSGMSLRPVLLQGAQNPNLLNGLVTQSNGQSSPSIVQMTAANLQLQSVVTSLNSFRDVLGPCTFVAPDASKYFVSINSNTDIPNRTDLPLVANSGACGSALGYYKGDQTFTLCPSACNSKGALGAIETDSCATRAVNAQGAGGASGGAGAGGRAGAQGGTGSCPSPNAVSQGAACSPDGLVCSSINTPCSCQKNQWTCAAQ